ncbi:MAG: cytidylate kinase-like family protein, partial [Deltaproteobacteria bacterium]
PQVQRKGGVKMPVITISRGSYSKGKEVAEKVGERLGYECLSRGVLLEASKEFNVPEIKLVRAIHDAPSILDRIGYRKDRYIAFIRSAILQHFRKNNVVYCGLAGHFFVKDIRHVLKVRVIADLDDRIQSEVDRENLSKKESLHMLKQDDEERRKWSKHLYGIDTWDPSLYDLVIHVGKMSTDDAAEVICNTAGLETFGTTPESQRAMEDLCRAAEVRAALMDREPDVDVVASDGIVQVHTAALLTEGEKLMKDIEAIAKSVEGVTEVKVAVKPKDYVD